MAPALPYRLNRTGIVEEFPVVDQQQFAGAKDFVEDGTALLVFVKMRFSTLNISSTNGINAHEIGAIAMYTFRSRISEVIRSTRSSDLVDAYFGTTIETAKISEYG